MERLLASCFSRSELYFWSACPPPIHAHRTCFIPAIGQGKSWRAAGYIRRNIDAPRLRCTAMSDSADAVGEDMQGWPDGFRTLDRPAPRTAERSGAPKEPNAESRVPDAVRQGTDRQTQRALRAAVGTPRDAGHYLPIGGLPQEARVPVAHGLLPVALCSLSSLTLSPDGIDLRCAQRMREESEY